MTLSNNIIRELRTYFLSLDRKNVLSDDIKPNADDTLRLGAPSKRFHAIYANRIIADEFSGTIGGQGGGSIGHADTLGDDYLTATEVAIEGNLYPLGPGARFEAGVLPTDIAYQNSTPTFTSINVTNYVDGIAVGAHNHSGSSNMGIQISHADLLNLSADHHTIYTRWDDTETIIKKWKFANLAEENQDFNEYVGWEIEASVEMEDDGGWKPVMETAQAVLQTLSFTNSSYPTYEHAYPLQIIAHAQYAAITLGASQEILIKTNDTDTWIDVGNIEISNANGISIGSTFSVDQAGALTSTSGTIADWVIKTDKLESSSGDVVLDADGEIILSGGSSTEVRLNATDANYRLWIGDESETTFTSTTAKFMVGSAGNVTAETMKLKGLLYGEGDKWRITSDGNAEFENIKARGRLDTIVYTKSTVSTIAGIMSLAKGGVLAQDITDSQTYIYLYSPAFSFGDIVLVQESADTAEWMQIVSTATFLENGIQDNDGNYIDVYKYTVSRDYDNSGNSYEHLKGTALNGRGSYQIGNAPQPLASGAPEGAFGEYQPSGTATDVGGGWITFDGELTRIDVNVRTGPLTTQYENFIRIGNLQGIGDYTEVEWGWYVGDANSYMAYDQTNGLLVYARSGATQITADGILSDSFILTLETIEPTTIDTDTAVIYYYDDLIKVRMDNSGSESTVSLATQAWVDAHTNWMENLSDDTSPTLGGDLHGGNHYIDAVSRVLTRQTSDGAGNVIYGYDDKSSEYLHTYIDPNGQAYIKGTDNIIIQSDVGGAKSIYLYPGSNLIVYFRDNAGGYKQLWYDSDWQPVSSINSDGDAFFAGTVDMKRTVEIVLLDNDTALETGDDFPAFYWCVPEELNGYNITDVDFWVSTASTSGAPSFDLYNVTDSTDILSVNCTIDANEKTSYTAATGPTINTANDDLATGDLIRFDCDAAGTGTKGCGVILVVEKP